MERTNPSFAIVLPMYNEAECAEKAIRLISEVLNGIPNPTKIIAVNDGSLDDTQIIVEKLLPQNERLVLLKHPVNRGYGGAVTTAIKYASQEKIEYVLFMDCDLTQDPKYIKGFLGKMDEGYDIIKGSRYIKEGAVEGVPAWRVVISVVGNTIAKVLFGLPIRDYTNGFRALKVSIAEQFHLTERGFSVLMEEIYQAKFIAHKYCEIPYTLSSRSEEQGTSTFSYRPRVIVSYLKYAMKSFLNVKPRHMK